MFVLVVFHIYVFFFPCNLSILLAVVNHCEWEMLPRFRKEKSWEQISLETASYASSRYFWSLLRSGLFSNTIFSASIAAY